MTHRVIRRRRARLDIEEAACWYAIEADAATAARFVAAIETAMRHVASHPAAGSLRYAAFGAYAEVRFWPVRGFPYLIFYRVHDGEVDVARVLHAERDIPRWLRDQE